MYTGGLPKCKTSSKLCSTFDNTKTYQFKFQWIRYAIYKHISTELQGTDFTVQQPQPFDAYPCT